MALDIKQLTSEPKFKKKKNSFKMTLTSYPEIYIQNFVSFLHITHLTEAMSYYYTLKCYDRNRNNWFIKKEFFKLQIKLFPN